MDRTLHIQQIAMHVKKVSEAQAQSKKTSDSPEKKSVIHSLYVSGLQAIHDLTIKLSGSDANPASDEVNKNLTRIALLAKKLRSESISNKQLQGDSIDQQDEVSISEIQNLVEKVEHLHLSQ